VFLIVEKIATSDLIRKQFQERGSDTGEHEWAIMWVGNHALSDSSGMYFVVRRASNGFLLMR